MSRLPTNVPKKYENFDFSLLKGKDVERIKALPSLMAFYSHRNLAFIGLAGTGMTHHSQTFGDSCCQHGVKTYFIKAFELRDRFIAARRIGKTGSCLSGLVRQSCLNQNDNSVVSEQPILVGRNHQWRIQNLF